ncbi:DUF3868 domain-containing protein [Bacteroides faecichinchillae]|uniref:DUF3868 domain-containing protein n=1 Tax=Bacteroides faecichinchillae TaxID=871325 RepID=UPI003519D618
MKHLYSSIILLALALRPIIAHADNETSYLPEIGIHHREVVRQNWEVELKMVVDLNRLKMRTQHTVVLTPVLVSADGNREAAFPPVVIDGKTRSKVYLRAQRLQSVKLPPHHDGSAQVVIRRINGKEQSYDYRAAMPYERWMLNGRIEIRERVSGCANCGKGDAQQPVPEAAEALAAFVPQYSVADVAPAPEPVKMRAEARTARLQFRQNSSNILSGYKNNQAELDSVSASIELVRQNSDVTITGISITGYASPEGNEAYNLVLSEKRARALADYVGRHNDIPADKLHVEWKGEDWEGFVRVLDDYPQLLNRNEVLAIIERYPNERDFCELQLRKLVPPTIYQRLLNEIYPTLRRNEYRIEYNVRNFSIEEAKRQIKIRPDLLSVSEMYKVAESYGKDADGYREALLTAAHTYPDNVAAVVNAARVEMERGDADAAIRLLAKSRVGNESEVLNALGVAYARSGQYDKAREVLQQALKAGSAEAQTNLKQLEGVVADL